MASPQSNNTDTEASSPLCAAFRRERSQNGTKFPALKSGLQKYVRRGETEKALWCAGELFSFRRAPEQDQTQRIETNYRHRLMIIFLEDVGMIGAWPRIDALNTGVLAAADEGAAASAYWDWVSEMCALPKSRACSHARAVASIRNIEDHRVPRAYAMACQLYPTVAALHAEHRLDPRFGDEPRWREALTVALRERSRSACLWAWAIETKGIPRKASGGRKAVWQIFEALEDGCRPEIAAMIPMARRWYKDLQNTREAFLCWMLPLLAQVDDHPLADDAIGLAGNSAAALETFTAQAPMEMDDYVYDIHVAPSANSGPAKGQGGLARFVEEGSLVENESPVVDQAWKAFYDDRKRIDEWLEPVGPPAAPAEPAPVGAELAAEDVLSDDFIDSLLEDIDAVDHTDAVVIDLPEVLAEPAPPEPPHEVVIDIYDDGDAVNAIITHESQFEFLVRAQINTSQNKTDVYFAREPGTGKTVVVKGPFASRDPADRAVEMAQWKRDNGLPATECRVLALVPDRWPEGVPLGIRNRVTRDTPSWFLVSDSLLPADPPRRHHSSKVWPPTEVVDWEDPALTDRHVWAPLKQWVAYTAQEKNDYVIALLARYVIGVSDLADRNFLRAGGRLYSLDEDGRVAPGAWVRIASELRAKKAERVRQWAEAHWGEIEPVVSAWRAPEGAEGRLHDVQTRLVALGLFTALNV